jgi:hypothetical protein
MCCQPKASGRGEGVDTGRLPPCRFIAVPMDFAMVSTAQRDDELVADLAAKSLALGEAKMMRVGRAATADQAWLLGDMADMLAVADAARLSKAKRALVDRFGFGALSLCMSRLCAAPRRRLFGCCRLLWFSR